MHFVLRADGGPDIGYGHLVRTHALAEEALERGFSLTVATTTPQPAKDIFADAVDVTELPSRDDPEPFVEWLETSNPDAVFTDAYPVDTAYQRALRERVPLAVFQDDARHTVCADVFVNGNLYADSLRYDFLDGEPETCLGPEYVLLRGEIRNLLDAEPPWREHPERALVTMGGSDMTNQTPTAIRAFDGVNIRVDAIVGPGFSRLQEREIRTAAQSVSADVHLSRDPDDLAEQMLRADFAVSTSSSTTYELLALGTPIVSVPVVDNQEPIAAALREEGVASVLERGADESAFARAIHEYVSDTMLRREHRNLGRELVDGKGPGRVTDVMCGVLEP